MQKVTQAFALPILATAPIDGPVGAQEIPAGFRHFLGTPKPAQRFKAYGIDPLDAPGHSEKVRTLMNRLSRRMDAAIPWPVHRDATIERWENPGIPSGYTYLLQFVAHDLVHSAIPLSVTGTLGADTANARRSALKLETLFGSGPVGSPFVYAQDTPNDEQRTKLRLGRMRWKDKEVESGCPFRDIARTPAENVTGIDRGIPGRRVALTEALVADPRNDDHALMSQLTALFALLHNGLVDMVRRGEPTTGINANLGAAYKRFLCARDALTTIYHNIIRNDLMKRIIDPAIYAAYSAAAPALMDRPTDFDIGAATAGRRARDQWQIPLEFSHGAFRFGHAMVRPEYVINDLSTHDLINTLEKTSASDPVNMPLDSSWIVRWSRFFEIGGSRPNFSRRIGPQLSDGLGHDKIFPAVDQTNRVGLLYRDLLGSTLAGLWSVDAMIAEISRRRPQFIRLSRLLADRAYRVSQIREWLAAEPSYGRLTSDDIETLANDPPLPFFVLFEAMQQPETQGLRLGLLGSIIVSEVIFGALEHNELSVARNAHSLGEALAAISAQYYPTNVFEGIPEIAGMDQLVEFTAEIGDLRQAVPAFL
ncbi:peroxidase family protein [Bradyrhizobium sp. S69]|uniref:peroxidase family protein n=1 Tax=Bradyrhizobium sp. S69 TaxID=1641856 RepID=UPI00131AA50B|nr:peroxidase family protein [Bradyrhizobium sp. S69]